MSSRFAFALLTAASLAACAFGEPDGAEGTDELGPDQIGETQEEARRWP